MNGTIMLSTILGQDVSLRQRNEIANYYKCKLMPGDIISGAGTNRIEIIARQVPANITVGV
jgi:hypothetical protein